jgi:hypothetical protein
VDLSFALPPPKWGSRWSVCIDTTKERIAGDDERQLDAGGPIALVANSTMVLKRVTPVRGSWRAAAT